MLTYINQQVSQANSSTALSDLGNLAFSISQVALITRFLDVTRDSPYKSIFTLNDLEVRVNDTETFCLDLENDYSSWDYCKYSDIMKDDVILYWEYTDTLTLKQDNLPNVVKLLLLKVLFT